MSGRSQWIGQNQGEIRFLGPRLDAYAEFFSVDNGHTLMYLPASYMQ